MKHQKIFNRLRRIEGQIRGIEDMVAKDRADTEILIQLSAAKSAITSTIGELLSAQLEQDSDGKIVLTQDQADLLIREIKG